ncbi:hypothetical protein [Shinella sedimenti]|uniref:Bartonella effector protein BID domain-containing protein n=1 Tax=Shinella sedimenti TaxID=2919913 RepID=A0ABT0CKH6_9HYPH|nr:hypothetical protein [Shinella sedimenti]MCJ8149095.1 hypothetical protein [Shinella sedimenti]
MAGLFGTRAQIQPIKQTAIQPTGIPGSTFVRPQQREVGANSQRLGEALAALNPALMNFAKTIEEEKNDPTTRANKEQVARLQQMNREQLVAEIKSGSLDGKRVQQDAAELLLAERANDDLRTRWTEFYNTEFNRSTGDAHAEFERIRQGIAADLPSEVSRGHLYRLSADFGRAWMEKDVEEKIANVKQEVATTIVGGFRNSIDDAINLHGKTPEEAARIIFGKSAANRAFLDLSGQEQNETVISVAEEYSNRGRPDIVKALLEADRVGEDGRIVPSIASTQKWASTALKLIRAAENLRDEEWTKDDLNGQRSIEAMVQEGRFTEEAAKPFRGRVSDDWLNKQVVESDTRLRVLEVQRTREEEKAAARREAVSRKNEVRAQVGGILSRHGGRSRLRDMELPNASGTGTTTYTVEQQVKDEVAAREADWRRERDDMLGKGVSEQDADKALDAKKLDWYAAARVTNAEWDSLLNGFAAGAAADTILQGGQVSAHYVKSAELYRRLKAGNSAYVRTFLSDDDSRAMLDYYDRLVTEGRKPPEEAIRTVAAWGGKQPWERVTARALRPADETAIVDDMVKELDLDARGSDWALITRMVRGMAEGENMTLADIKANLPKKLRDSTVAVNGVLVEEHRDLPDDFPQLMEERLAELSPMIAKRHGLDENDPSDLYVQPVSGETKWEVWSKQRGGTGFFILPKDLAVMTDRKNREREEIATKLRSEKEVERGEAFAAYQDDLRRERASVEKWEARAAKRPSRLNKSVAEKLRANFTERVIRDLTVTERAEKKRADEQKMVREFRQDHKDRHHAVLSFLRSLVPSVKVGDTMVIGK